MRRTKSKFDAIYGMVSVFHILEIIQPTYWLYVSELEYSLSTKTPKKTNYKWSK